MIRLVAIGDGWLVVEKPPGVSVHNEPGRDLRSQIALQVAGDHRLNRQIAFHPGYGFNAVGRLDREADGLVLLAWRPEVFAALSAQYAGRSTGKSYVVLLHGRPGGGRCAAGGLQWTRPLSQEAGGRRSPAGAPPRVECRTEVRVLESGGDFTLVECRPHTGRKHQIRRHAALAGHPVAGDRRYGSIEAADRLQRRYGFDRIGLHARRLTFRPPETDTPITVETGAVPPSFSLVLGGSAA